jgi:hypothetical protein
MSMIGFSFIELLILVFLGGSPLGLPLSMPPLPEDPAMSQVAPQECLWYLTWSGCAKPDPQSKNHTEQLLAEQEVQHFTSELETRLRDALKRGAPQGAQATQAAILAEEGPNLVKVLLTRPTALFIERAAVSPAGAIVKGGAVISAGDQSKAVKDSIDRIVQVLLPQAKGSVPGELKLPMPPGAPPVELRWHKDYLVIGVGEDGAEDIIKRFGGKTPDWLANVRKELAVERPSVVHFLNIQTVLANVLPFAGLEGFKVANSFGVDRVRFYANVSGLEGTSAVSRSLLSLDGKPRGLFTLLEAEPLKPADLARIPKDATFALAAKFDLDRAIKGLVSIVGQFDPQAQQQFDRTMAEARKELGFDVSQDIFQSLGNTWTVYNSPGEGGLVFTGLTAVVTVKDRERLLKAHDKLLANVRAVNEELARLNADNVRRGRRPGAVLISDFKFAGHTVYFVNTIGAEAPFAPAWCVTDDELIVSLFPQMIKARLSRGSAGGSLGDLPEIADCFRTGQAPNAIFYQDTRSIFRLMYPLAHMFAAFICGELQQERVDIDVSLLPSMAAIEPHLHPGVSAVYVGENGIRWQSRQTLPGVSGALPVLGMSVFLFGARSAAIDRDFAIRAETRALDLTALAPGAAIENTSRNNLKQIGLAMHLFLDVHKHFPVADGAGSDGKPKLSWRVHILPFIEEQNLFNQFKLDEPWDSEHNKKLIEKMPTVYRTPGSKAFEQHKTNYVAVRGKDTLLPAGAKTTIKSITDGLSQTAMVLEVADEHAVVWTKPDDFEPDKDDPLKGVIGLRDGKFLVLLADGSVHTLPASIDKETVKALYTRAGGEAVDLRK